MSQAVLQVAAKALIVNPAGHILIAREASAHATNAKAGQYGLIGGRLEPGEPFFDGLAREVREETGLTITPGKPLYVGEWRPVIHGIERQIIGIFMLCQAQNDTIALSPEHDDFRWIDPADRHHYPLMEPDCYALDHFMSALDIKC